MFESGPIKAFSASFLLTGLVWAADTNLPDPLDAGWQGNAVCERLQDDEHQRILRCTFPPGVGHERHFHAPHFGYTLSGGRMKITDAGGTREVDIPTSSTFISEGVEWHEVLNIGETTASFLIIESQSQEETGLDQTQ